MNLHIWTFIRVKNLPSAELIQIVWWVPDHTIYMSWRGTYFPFILLKGTVLLLTSMIVVVRTVKTRRGRIMLHWLERTTLIAEMLCISIVTRHKWHSWEFMGVEGMSVRGLHHHMWMSAWWTAIHSIMMSGLRLEPLQDRYFWFRIRRSLS